MILRIHRQTLRYGQLLRHGPAGRVKFVERQGERLAVLFDPRRIIFQTCYFAEDLGEAVFRCLT